MKKKAADPQDGKTVITLDAGGTNLVFGAVQSGNFIAGPVSRPTETGSPDQCMRALTDGFAEMIALAGERPSAISFAFPGPADYVHGVIGGNLPNFPAFRNGIALGPALERIFRLPVFIHNDGSLFAYGQAAFGALPALNARLEAAGSEKRYRNLIGITLGTGFGCGIVHDGELLFGDNGNAAGLWCLRNYRHPELVVEENVSSRAVRRIYRELSGDGRDLTPKDICLIAGERMEGDKAAALGSFASLGHFAGDAIATAASLIDGVVVIGGGLAGAAEYFMPSLIESMTSPLSLTDGTTFSRMQSEVIWLKDDSSFAALASSPYKRIKIYGSEDCANYEYRRRTPVLLSEMEASTAIALGAYAYAVRRMTS